MEKFEQANLKLQQAVAALQNLPAPTDRPEFIALRADMTDLRKEYQELLNERKDMARKLDKAISVIDNILEDGDE